MVVAMVDRARAVPVGALTALVLGIPDTRRLGAERLLDRTSDRSKPKHSVDESELFDRGLVIAVASRLCGRYDRPLDICDQGQ